MPHGVCNTTQVNTFWEHVLSLWEQGLAAHFGMYVGCVISLIEMCKWDAYVGCVTTLSGMCKWDV